MSLIKRYSPKRVILVHGDGGSRHALGGLLKKSAHVDWPQNGEVIDPSALTHFERLEQKREIEPASGDKKKTKLVRFNTTATASVEGQKLVLTLPDDVDVQHLLGGVDTFSMEVAKGARLKVDLKEKG